MRVYTTVYTHCTYIYKFFNNKLCLINVLHKFVSLIKSNRDGNSVNTIKDERWALFFRI